MGLHLLWRQAATIVAMPGRCIDVGQAFPPCCARRISLIAVNCRMPAHG
jgi:hypothetical protein